MSLQTFEVGISPPSKRGLLLQRLISLVSNRIQTHRDDWGTLKRIPLVVIASSSRLRISITG